MKQEILHIHRAKKDTMEYGDIAWRPGMGYFSASAITVFCSVYSDNENICFNFPPLY